MAVPENKRVQQPRRGTRENDNYIGPDGQITVDNQRRELRLHDGKKKGGWTIPNLTNLKKMFLSSEAELGKLEFPEESKGFLTRTANKIYQLRLLVGGDGITIEHDDGSTGNPTIGLPGRLKKKQEGIADANLAIETGFYVVWKGKDSNLPEDFKLTSSAAIEVITNEGETGGILFQVARPMALADNLNVYTRKRVDNIWSAWSKKADPVIPAAPLNGDINMLDLGVNDVKRLWSSSDISNFVRAYVVQTIQSVNAANAAVNKLYNQLFNISGSNSNTTTQTVGPFNMTTGDMFEIVSSATAVKSPAGDSQTARIEIEKSDLTWDTIASAVVTTLANEEAKTISIAAKFIKTANGYQVTDSSWTVVSTVVATLTGRMRVTIGIQDQAGARAARWR